MRATATTSASRPCRPDHQHHHGPERDRPQGRDAAGRAGDGADHLLRRGGFADQIRQGPGREAEDRSAERQRRRLELARWTEPRCRGPGDQGRGRRAEENLQGRVLRFRRRGGDRAHGRTYHRRGDSGRRDPRPCPDRQDPHHRHPCGRPRRRRPGRCADLEGAGRRCRLLHLARHRRAEGHDPRSRSPGGTIPWPR